MSEPLSIKWNRRLRGLTMFVFNFGVESLEQSVKLGRLVILISLAIPFYTHHFFQTDNRKAVLFTVFFLLELFFSYCIVVGCWKKSFLKRRPLFRLQIFSISKCCDIQGSYLIGYLWVSSVIDLSECLVRCFLRRLLHWITWKLHLSYPIRTE